jgi:TolA-binding protein
MDWQDFIGPVSGVIVAVVGLRRAQTIASGHQAEIREEGAAAVVPQLRERLDAQDKRIDELRNEVAECEKRSSDFVRQLTEVQGQFDRAISELAQARQQISALVSLLPVRDRDRFVSLPPPQKSTGNV